MSKKLYCVFMFVFVLAGCGGGSGAMNSMPSGGSSTTESVSHDASAAAASSLTFFNVGSNPKADTTAFRIAQGSDGAMYYTTFGPAVVNPQGERVPAAGNVGRLDPSSGSFVEIPLNGPGYALQFAPDGALWTAELTQGKLARLTLPLNSSSENDIALPPTSSRASPEPRDLVLGSDGNIWFTDLQGGRVGKINPAGPYATSAITTFAVPNGPAGTPGLKARPWGITAGPDANLWFADHRNGIAYKLTTAGAMTGYVTPLQKRVGVNGFAGPFYLAPAGGNLYVTELGADASGNDVAALDELSTSGTFNTVTIPSRSGPFLAGSTGTTFTFSDVGQAAVGIYRADTKDLREYPASQLSATSATLGGVNSVIVARDGTVWFACNAPRTPGGPLCLGHLVLAPTWSVFPSNTINLIRNSTTDTVQLIGIGETGNSGPFTVVSSNPNVVKVFRIGGLDHNFYLSPVGYKRAFVTITDANHRSQTITVNVSQ